MLGMRKSISERRIFDVNHNLTYINNNNKFYTHFIGKSRLNKLKILVRKLRIYIKNVNSEMC